jgi:hypothetical protein
MSLPAPAVTNPSSCGLSVPPLGPFLLRGCNGHKATHLFDVVPARHVSGPGHRRPAASSTRRGTPRMTRHCSRGLSSFLLIGRPPARPRLTLLSIGGEVVLRNVPLSPVFCSGAASTQARLEAARAAAGPPSHWLLRRPLLFPRKHHALRVHRLIHAMPSPTSSRNMLPWRALPHRDDDLLEPRAAGPRGRRPKPSLGPHPAAVAMFLPSQ